MFCKISVGAGGWEAKLSSHKTRRAGSSVAVVQEANGKSKTLLAASRTSSFDGSTKDFL
jgi:hypothetical protein